MHRPSSSRCLLSFFCLHLNNSVASESASRAPRCAASSGNRRHRPVEEGNTPTSRGRSVYVGAREGNLLKDMRVVETTKSGSIQEIRAREALITSSKTSSSSR